MMENEEQQRIDALWLQLGLNTQYEREVFCVQLIAQRLTGHMPVVSSVDDGWQIGFEGECEHSRAAVEGFMDYYFATFPQVYKSKLEALTILIIAYQQYEAHKAWPELLTNGD